MTVTLVHRDAVSVLDLGDDENRFSPGWLDEVGAALDSVVAGPATALVLTATGKFFSNGLDVDWVMADATRWPAYVDRVQALTGAGAQTFVEIGSKDVLTNLLKRIDGTRTGIALGSAAAIEAFVNSD